ncbi:uncharacterized protein DUF5117 [Prosthecobacter fusiformis]|uniref:Uncharacterized protein DUF5117 n=1 Tax=Prosthecobacter fusiformis TaxID=48464 RepID=A0A4R7RZP7_9BACT|nr:zinc-dependent metalloprotease [Prosthecobacter fusiformis]TDU70626.1 uncharacterized protein DUF5117 [Prosthecobacter fusiformis]
MRLLLTCLVCFATFLNAAEPAPKPAPSPEPKPAPGPIPGPPPAPPEKPEVKPEPAKAPVAEKKEEKTGTKPTVTAKRKTLAEVTRGHQHITGLFEFYLDRDKGTLHLYVKKDQLGPEFIYFNQTMDGVVQAGHNRGQYGDERIFRIARTFERIEFIAENTAFYFDPQNPLSRAAKANTSHAVMASESIVADDANGYLISATNLFLRESLLMIKPIGSEGNKAVLGKLSETKTKMQKINGYPDNTAVLVEYVYENAAPSWSNDDKVKADEITDPRYVSIRVQHNLIRVPVNDFKPRFDDPRVGYFSTQVTDMTSTGSTPFRDVIHRWHLVKQKPGTKLSEPVQPIVFWIENTTPVELRDVIREATLRWNQAFETAGFKDAIVVKQQSDNATWDAGDINYNVLRWTSSPNPPFGGYGPSFVNPRTGQILGADIMLEFSFLTNRLRSQRLFTELGLASAEDETTTASSRDPHLCLDSKFAQQGLLFGNAALRLRSGTDAEMKDLTREALIKLVLHEVGHTLGLNHNFRASHLYDAVTIHQKEVTSKTGLTGSVMDYMPANIAPLGVKQGEYYITKPGPYDHWAIEYGYSEALEDPEADVKRLKKIAARSHQPELAFGNDADDMRSVGSGIDPRAMIYDMSADPVAYGSQRCELVKARLAELLTKEPRQDESWHSLTQAYITLTSESANALVAMSRYIGGVYVERAFVGQAPGTTPYVPAPKVRQEAALAAIGQYAFSPDAWSLPPDLISHLQQQRRGFDFRHEDEAPKLHERIAQLQKSLLDHFTHTDTQRRILDSALYGNEVLLPQVMSTLTTAIFTGDPAAGPNTMRQNLQSEYLDRLLKIVNSSSYLPAAQAVAFGEIERIRTILSAPPLVVTPSHALFLTYKIKRGLDQQ